MQDDMRFQLGDTVDIGSQDTGHWPFAGQSDM